MFNETSDVAIDPLTRLEPTLKAVGLSKDSAPSRPLQNETKEFTFTGSGKEYFRIWIVNLCLTIATIGIYSAWAKVRRLQYFHRNTQLGGAVFDFHGDPVAILKGRILAIGLVSGYQYAFGFSKSVGIGIVCVLVMILPWLMRSALRFRMRNTSYRGLRFNFGGSSGGAYLTFFPIVLLFFLPSVLLALDPTYVKFIGYMFLLYLLWPLMNAQIKRYQHGHLEYGSSRAIYFVKNSQFLKPYFFAALIGIAGMFVAGILTAMLIRGGAAFSKSILHTVIEIGAMVIFAYFAYLLTGPYLQTRIYNIVWNNTRFPNVDIHSDLRAKAYIKLQLVNTILTLLSLGLFRPFAVVRTYEYRLSCMSVKTPREFDNLLSAERRLVGDATGDGAADFLGIDLSW